MLLKIWLIFLISFSVLSTCPCVSADVYRLKRGKELNSPLNPIKPISKEKSLRLTLSTWVLFWLFFLPNGHAKNCTWLVSFPTLILLFPHFLSVRSDISTMKWKDNNPVTFNRLVHNKLHLWVKIVKTVLLIYQHYQSNFWFHRKW